jgi:dTDP-4-dehydrorhamnose reductase
MRLTWPTGWRVVGTTSSDLDITDAAAVAVERPDLILNCAAYTAVDKAEGDQECAYAVNRDGVANLAATGVPIVHLSTDYVFNGRPGPPWRESDATGPLGVYGASKLAGEQALAGHRAVVLRTAWVFGRTGGNFVKTMLRLAKDRDQLTVVEDQQGGPTPAEAIAVACQAVGQRLLDDASVAGVYHFAGAPATTWADFARAILAASAPHGGRVVPVKGIATADYPTPAKRPANSVLDCSRIAATFGISQPDWREALHALMPELMS